MPEDSDYNKMVTDLRARGVEYRQYTPVWVTIEGEQVRAYSVYVSEANRCFYYDCRTGKLLKTRTIREFPTAFGGTGG